MQEVSKRRLLTRRNAVVMAGSLHRSKLKIDEGTGGLDVFNGKERHKNDGSGDEEGARGCRRLRRNQSGRVATERRRPSNFGPSEMEENFLTQRSTVKIRKAPKSLRKDHLEIEGQKQILPVGDSIEGAEEGEMEEKIENEIKQGEWDLVDKMMDLPEVQSTAMDEEEEEGEEGEQIGDQKLGIHVLSQDEEKDMNPVSMPISMNAAEKKQIHIIPSHFQDVDRETNARASHEHNGIQSIVNLAMWRDASKSAFVFGCGTFFLLSSSYANDINFSLVSACSYVGLFYLAFVFLCKSIIRRGDTVEIDERDEQYMVGEEEAIWLLELLLPYVNELLLLLRSLFSGHPATTMKLALLLFVTARCGSCITIWSLAKLTFFGAFTIPKLYSAYSTQLAKLGKFWVERIKDGWESCGHKRAVGSAIFVLVWNISSTVARIWTSTKGWLTFTETVFMAVVAVRLYRQSVAECGWSEQEKEAGRENQLGLGSRRRREERKVIKSVRYERPQGRGWKEIKVDVSAREKGMGL